MRPSQWPNVNTVQGLGHEGRSLQEARLWLRDFLRCQYSWLDAKGLGPFSSRKKLGDPTVPECTSEVVLHIHTNTYTHKVQGHDPKPFPTQSSHTRRGYPSPYPACPPFPRETSPCHPICLVRCPHKASLLIQRDIPTPQGQISPNCDPSPRAQDPQHHPY